MTPTLGFRQVPVNRVVASANEIRQTLEIHENALSMKQQEFQAKYEASIAEIKDLRQKNAGEMQNIDSAASLVKQRVSPLVAEFSNRLKQAATEAVDTAEIEPKELNDRQAVSEKLGRLVAAKIKTSIEQQSEKIQAEIESGLMQEVSRLESFAQDVVRTLENIEMQFTSIEASGQATTSATGQGVTAALAIITGFGGIWSGYNEAGIKGAAVGAAGSFGTAAAAGLVMAVIGLPLSFPVILAVGALSVFTGGRLVKTLYGGEQVQNFKNNYQQAALAEIETKLTEANFERDVDRQIDNTFDRLKQTIRQEVDALLDNTQTTLTEISAKRERDEVMTKSRKRLEIQEMKQQTEQI